MTEQAALLSPQDLVALSGDPACVVVDCRFKLLDPEAGHAAYLQEHIPGARYADLDKDLAGPVSAESGRHPLPAPLNRAP